MCDRTDSDLELLFSKIRSITRYEYRPVTMWVPALIGENVIVNSRVLGYRTDCLLLLKRSGKQS